jgi:hypothetical protein
MPYGKPITKEELEEIRKQNREKLNEILSDVDYQIQLGKKYYGDRWFTILEDNHYAKREYRKMVNNGGGKPYVNYIDRPILQYDLDNKFIREWENARVWAESVDKGYSAAQHVAKCGHGGVMSQKDSAYGFKWRFKDNEG